MASVNYSDGTEVNQSLTNESMEKIWVSPSTMDSGDTVDVPTVTGATVRVVSCWDQDTGQAVTATVSSFTVTVDSGGGASNDTYVLKYIYT